MTPARVRREGWTDGVVSSQGFSTLFLEGSSVSLQEKMALSFEGINVLNLHNQPETILSLIHMIGSVLAGWGIAVLHTWEKNQNYL